MDCNNPTHSSIFHLSLSQQKKMTERENVKTKNVLTEHIPSLSNNWNVYFHHPKDNVWTLARYSLLTTITTFEQMISFNENMPENIIKYGMLFWMRAGVPPLYEDNCNKNGGCFSYKIPNKYVVGIWKDMVYLLCGNSLSKDPQCMNAINGITISPKKNFCIVKIWLSNRKHQNPGLIADITNLSKTGVIFMDF